MTPPETVFRWKCLVPALLLLAGWAGFVLSVGEEEHVVSHVTRQSYVDSTASNVGASGPASSRARPLNARDSAEAGDENAKPAANNLLGAVIAAAVVGDPQSPSQPALRFNGRIFGVDPRAPESLAALQRRMGGGSNVLALVGFTVFPGSKIRAELAARRLDLLEYVPDNGWIARVWGDRQSLPDLRLFYFHPFDAELRIESSLFELVDLLADVPIYLHVARDRTVAGILSALVAGGFDNLSEVAVGDRVHLAGCVAAQRLPDFLLLSSMHPDTLRIERGSGARLFNSAASRSVQSGSFTGSLPFFERGIFGTNQIIAVCDTGLDVDSCFFRDEGGQRPPINRLGGIKVDGTRRKVIAANFLDSGDDPENALAWDSNGHGTAVAGTAAGLSLFAPWDSQADNGIAPGAKLIIQDAGYRAGNGCTELPGLGCPVTNFYPAMLQAVAQGATIHNNSWGEDENLPINGYSEVCRELDAATWLNKQFLVVCAAGNNYFEGAVGTPSTAKNALSVAASLSGANDGRVASFSSRGWASDGRIKPDLTAPGSGIRTAASDGDITTENCYRISRSGTSFAAPVVSGLAALVRDYFARGFYPTGHPVLADRRSDVSAALVKAVLINAAEPMSSADAPPPSRDQGWGRVHLSQTLRLSADAPALSAIDESPGFIESPSRPFKTYLRITSTNRNLKVTLAWSDPPATPGVDRHLVNDLDLRVRTPRWVLKGNHRQNGQSVPGGDYDRLNNVEQVEWLPGRAEMVEISVWAHRIAVGPQDFAIIGTGDFETISPQQDLDHDGLPDHWELWHFGNLNPRPDEDVDADGATHRQEFEANTDPRDADSIARIEIDQRDTSGTILQMKIHEGRRYTLERSVGGSPQGLWTSASEPIFLGTPTLEGYLHFKTQTWWRDPEGGACFYRVRIDSSR